jgi:hypothetical protein
MKGVEMKRPRNYSPTSISPHAVGSTRICHACEASLPHAQMTEIHPVPGLTMYRCPACVELLARVLAYAKSRWCWDDAAMLGELFERDWVRGETVEGFVDAWARDYDLTDPRDVGMNP